MHNCIYSGHCSRQICDKSCPTLVETTYLLERNNIHMNSNVFHSKSSDVSKYLNIVNSSEGKLKTVVDRNTVETADLLTYCGICQKWKGSRLHCTVYNLRYSQYTEAIRKTWTTKQETESIEYMRIWSTSAKLLIISNIDYVKFRDFECQTLLTLLQDRASNKFTTIIVSPPLSSLVGDSPFFGKLVELMKKAVNS